MKFNFLLAFFLGVGAVVAEEPGQTAKTAELPLVVAPSFKKPLDSSFSIGKGSWTPADGILTAEEVAADKHVAVLHHNVGLSTAVVECEFKLEGSPMFLVGCDGKKGHIGRVVVKGGAVEIAEDSAKPSHVIATLKMPVTQNEWHHLRVEWSGDAMMAILDDHKLEAKDPYFANPKSRTWLAVPKTKTEIRNLTIRGEKTEAK